MVTDVAAYVGGYPYRHLDDPSPEWLVRQMDRLGIERAWVGYLPAAFYRDPAAGTPALRRLVAPYPGRLVVLPAIHPGFPRWEDDLRDAVATRSPAVRVYPCQLGLDPAGPPMRALAAALGAAGLPLVLTARFEDGRQRHPLDRAEDLPAAAVRALLRADPKVRILVSHADRPFIEEVHFGSTPEEAGRVLWDIAWVWGPPEDHLALLIDTVGVERFTLGTGMPLRIPDTAFARLDLLDTASARSRILDQNLERWISPRD